MALIISPNPPEGYYYLLETIWDVDGERYTHKLYYTTVEGALDAVYDCIDRNRASVMGERLIILDLNYVFKMEYSIHYDVNSQRLRVVLT